MPPPMTTLLVNLQAWEWGGLATSCDKNVLSDDARLSAIVELDLDCVLVLESGRALDILDAILLEQELNALGQARDRLILCLHHLREVELYITDIDTTVFRVVENLVVEMGVVEERL